MSRGASEENLVAFCDVDRDQCAENMKNWRTTQPFFEDFRVMLDKMHKEIDAVVVSTPDHTHFRRHPGGDGARHPRLHPEAADP
jgi:predicted dehydrogenase